ncbi:MAG TPA: hypothetical protein PL143_17590 [Rhodocyclaceae bacterium]|nr:hypothetical protein [Rhodocyclaceae bacterium]
MTSIAVPASLTPGDSAREAISASTDRPKRGSWSYERSSPITNTARKSSTTASSSMPTLQPSGRAGSTKAPGSALTKNSPSCAARQRDSSPTSMCWM